MRWFMDTEFDENGSTIKLISIALVSESGEEYYACLVDGWKPEECDDWVREHVLAKLPDSADGVWKMRHEVRRDLRDLLLRDGKPEIWGYFSDYDWVVFCQLWGKMIDLPKGMPMFCLDLKQEMVRRRVSREQLAAQDPKIAHSALADARWIRAAWLDLNDNNAERDE
jgi:hypothetical protein